MAGESIGLVLPPWIRRTLIVMAVLVVGAMAFAIFEPIQVLPRIRLAPGFAMTDQTGRPFTSDTARGQVTVYAFAYGDCGNECAPVHDTMSEVARRVPQEVDLGGAELALVTVSFDPSNDAERLADLAAETGADGELWRWATLEEDDVADVVGAGFRVYNQELEQGGFVFDPTFVVVDGWGVIRGEYQYATLSSDADKLVRHIGVLGEELRNSNGVTSIAYEAAHVFLCYP